MKRFALGFAVLLAALSAGAGKPKPPKKPIKVVMSPASRIPTADIVKNLNQKCPNVSITLDSTKSDYMLEANWFGGYKFTLYRHGGDEVYATTTHFLSNAVKDVCKYINSQN